MTPVEKMREWLKTFPSFDILGTFRVDYADHIPNMGSIAPEGLTEVSRRADIFGNQTVVNRYNFGLYFTLPLAPGDDVGATINADWLMEFQEWIQEQSLTGRAPVFGDAPFDEKITAQNGQLYYADGEGTATYMIQLSVQFIKKVKVNNPWLI